MNQYQEENTRTELARELAAEGIVLLQNDKGCLPLKEHSRIAVFGRASYATYIGGSGSGATDSKRAVMICDGIREAGFELHSGLGQYYQKCLEEETASGPALELPEGGIAELVNSGLIYEIFGKYHAPVEEFEVPDELFAQTARFTDTALLTIGRCSGGEECDRRFKNDYMLLLSERELIRRTAETFRHVIVVLNINGAVDTAWIREYPSVEAVFFFGTPGEQGGAALGRLLCGKQNPSGRLAATFALSYEDYPTAKHFSSNKDQPDSILTYWDYGLDAEKNGSCGFTKSPVTVYQEGIYLGYRYFDTYDKVVMYPFGHGLSYTVFDYSELQFRKEGEDICLRVKVTNKGRFVGKEVLQLYVSAPQGRLDKPYQEYLTCIKTGLLKPEESEWAELRFPARELASYDEETASYVIEKGTYLLRLGTSSRCTKEAAAVTVEEEITAARCQNRLMLSEANRGKLVFLKGRRWEEQDGVGLGLPHILLEQNDIEIYLEHESEEWDTEAQADGSSMQDVMEGRVTMAAFVNQMSAQELAVLVNGYGPGLPFGGMGGKYPNSITYEDGREIGQNTHPSGNLGYLSPAIEAYGIKSAFYKDGPAGVGKTAWPTGTVLACMFNDALLYEFGAACGYEAESLNVDSWLGPALNLQRSPIGGRNFEYFSEDPRLTGMCGLMIAKGAMEQNHLTVCPKHFALNEQETYRRGSKKKNFDAADSIVEERTARELYLKPFEMLVRGSETLTLMTAFNKINGVFAAGNKELCVDILRKEWGYRGVVVTDWGDMDIVADGADAVAAGNDVIMPGGPPVIKEVLDGYREGRCSLNELRRAAANLLNFVAHTKSQGDSREE